MKLCKDCRHAQLSEHGRWTCYHPTVGVHRFTSPVTGEVEVVQIDCNSNRTIGNCPNGQHWEPKEEPAPAPGFVEC
jgi:hypothetical protein